MCHALVFARYDQCSYHYYVPRQCAAAESALARLLWWHPFLNLRYLGSSTRHRWRRRRRAIRRCATHRHIIHVMQKSRLQCSWPTGWSRRCAAREAQSRERCAQRSASSSFCFCLGSVALWCSLTSGPSGRHNASISNQRCELKAVGTRTCSEYCRRGVRGRGII